MNLYNVASDMINCLDKENFDIEELGDMREDFKSKAINLAGYIKNLECEEKMLEEAIEELKKKLKTKSMKRDFIKGFLLRSMHETNIHSIEYSHFDIKVMSNPVSVYVEDETLIPDEFLRKKIVLSPDKNKIKEFIENGGEISGCKLQVELRLEIK